jgi:hypothetical protein
MACSGSGSSPFAAKGNNPLSDSYSERARQKTQLCALAVRDAAPGGLPDASNVSQSVYGGHVHWPQPASSFHAPASHYSIPANNPSKN